jgi:carbon storage regulator CsrA
MLVLSRKIGETIVIDGNIQVTVSAVQGGRVKLCIEAPRECRVLRGEVADTDPTPAMVRRPNHGNLPPAAPQLAGS